MNRIFVYGSLLSDLGNHGFLKNQTLVGEGRTKDKYTLFDLGSFPGLVENGTTSVVGEIYDVDEDAASSIDMLEGICEEDPDRGLYKKVKIEMESGELIDGYIYNTHGDRDLEEVTSGDWKEYYKQKRGAYRFYG